MCVYLSSLQKCLKDPLLQVFHQCNVVVESEMSITVHIFHA